MAADASAFGESVEGFGLEPTPDAT
jgi:hypothetical protein